MSDIALYVNGKLYKGWKSATVDRTLDAVSGSFSLGTNNKWDITSDPWEIHPGDECRVEIDGTPLITGYVDKVSPMYTATTHEIRIEGRDKTGDLVDCSAIVKSFEVRGQTIAGLARLLCAPFGINVIDKVGDTEVFPSVAIQPGETVWSCIERQARQREIIATTDGSGSLILCKAGTETAADSLVEGKNILEASADYDFSNVFSKYTVKGQMQALGESADSWNPPDNSVEASISDSTVKRYRPLIITAESECYEKTASVRAAREKAKRLGDALNIAVTVQGWTQSNGTLWPLNGLVKLKSPVINFIGQLVISGVTFLVDDSSGTTTQLTLKSLNSFINLDDPVKVKTKKKKTSAAAADDDDAENYWE